MNFKLSWVMLLSCFYAITSIDLVASGRGIADTQVKNGFGQSSFDFQTNSGVYVESKFGTASLNSGAQKDAANFYSSQGSFELQSWSYPTVSGMAGSGVTSGAAGSPVQSAYGK